MKNLVLVFIAASALFYASCNGKKSPFPGYTDEGNGTYSKWLKKGTGTVTPDTGSLVFLHMQFKNGKDSAFMNININPRDPSHKDISRPVPISKARFKGGFMYMLMKMHEGDSVSFFISLDSLNKYYADSVMGPDGKKVVRRQFDFRNQQFDTMKYVGFAVRIDSIYSRQKFAEFRQKETERRQEQMKEQAFMDSVHNVAHMKEPLLKKQNAQLMKKYIADNHVTAKPDKDGIYFIPKEPGSGTPVKDGMTVSLMYTGTYLDGTIFDANTLMPGQQPLVFVTGKHQLIPGFENCVMKMQQGEKATFILPPAQAYRDSLTRVFNVQLIDVRQ